MEARGKRERGDPPFSDEALGLGSSLAEWAPVRSSRKPSDTSRGLSCPLPTTCRSLTEQPSRTLQDGHAAGVLGEAGALQGTVPAGVAGTLWQRPPLWTEAEKPSKMYCHR